ncbi:hypothetical protein D3C87_1644620 [compost metagenome]
MSRCKHLSVIPGFGDVAVHLAAVDGRNGRADVGIPRKQHTRCSGPPRPNLRQQFGAIHPGHSHIGEDQIHRFAFQVGDGFQATGRRGDLVPAPSEQALECGHDVGLVIDTENAPGLRLFLRGSGAVDVCGVGRGWHVSE